MNGMKSSRSLQPEVDCEITIGLKKFNPNPSHLFRVKRGPGKGKVFIKTFKNKLLMVRGKHRCQPTDLTMKAEYSHQSFEPRFKGLTADFDGR